MTLAQGQITIADLTDNLVTGPEPANPAEGTLWVDTSVDPNKIYRWENGTWINQTLSIEGLDPDFNEQVEYLKTSVQNASSDGVISSGEKLSVKLLLVQMTGDSLTGDSLPTIENIDFTKGGEVYSVRQEAMAAGVLSTHTDYKSYETAYANLKAYLEGLDPKPWKPGDTTIDPAVWNQKWDDYYTKLGILTVTTSSYLSNSLKPGSSYNGVTIDSDNGVVALRGDNLFKVTLNATDGIKIEKNNNGIFAKAFYANTDGKIYANSLVIGADSSINGTEASTVVTNASNGNAANTTISSNKSTWDRASNINSDGTLNTSKLNGEISDTQISSAINWNEANNIVNSWKGVAVNGVTTIDGGLIQTNTILSDKMNVNEIFSNSAVISKIQTDSVQTATLNASNMTTGTLDASKATVTNLNAGNITTGYLSGSRLAANTITAQHIAIGDYTNLSQINEDKVPNGNTVVAISSQNYFKVGDSAYAKLVVWENTYQEFKLNDEYYVAFTGYRDSGVTALNCVMRYFYTDGTYTNGGVASVLPGTSSARKAINLKITAEPNTSKKLSKIQLFFEKDGTAGSGYYYVRDIEIRKRYVGELIVDGTIKTNHLATNAVTAEKISVSNLSALSANLGTVTAGTIKGISIEGSNFSSNFTGSDGSSGSMYLDDQGISFHTVLKSNDPTYPNIDRITKYTDKGIQIDRVWTGVGGATISLDEHGLSFSGHGADMNGHFVISNGATGDIEFIHSGYLIFESDGGGGIQVLGGGIWSGGDLEMNNNNISNVNHITINDPGGSEGIEWLGGNGWKIVEAPYGLSNSSGDLQFATYDTSQFTITTGGSVWAQGSFHGRGTGNTYFVSNGTTIVKSDATNAGTGIYIGDDGNPRIWSMDVYNRTYSSGANLYITGAGTIGRSTSARKYKIDIESVPDDIPEKILGLVPRTWHDKSATEAWADYLTKKENGEEAQEPDVPYLQRISGLIAEEVVDAGLPQFVIYGAADENGNREVEGLQYDRLWVLLIPLVKEQKQKIADLEKRIVELETSTQIQ